MNLPIEASDLDFSRRNVFLDLLNLFRVPFCSLFELHHVILDSAHQMDEVRMFSFQSLHFSHSIGHLLICYSRFLLHLSLFHFKMFQCPFCPLEILMSAETTLIHVYKTSGQSSTTATQISIESNGIHVTSTTPRGCHIYRPCQKLPCKYMFHGAADCGVECDALFHEWCHICAVRISNIVYLQLIQREEGDATKPLPLQTVHELRRRGIGINNNVKQRVLSCHFHGSLVFGIGQFEIFHHQSEVLNPHSKLFLHHYVFQGIQTHRRRARHGFAHIVECFSGRLSCLGYFIGQIGERFPLGFSSVGHFIPSFPLLINGLLEILKNFGLFLQIISLLFRFFAFRRKRLSKIG
mmetsp:Transcript_26763/g.57018  ORF Transcript_26763/g.57018 Transcript_26763/m.57018 type:complete len:351 (+) Transcript_26763:984-2036(+)